MSHLVTDSASLGRYMRGLRQDRGWTLRDTHAEVGILEVVVSSWERGDRRPNADQLVRWAAAFDQRFVVASKANTTRFLRLNELFTEEPS